MRPCLWCGVPFAGRYCRPCKRDRDRAYRAGRPRPPRVVAPTPPPPPVLVAGLERLRGMDADSLRLVAARIFGRSREGAA